MLGSKHPTDQSLAALAARVAGVDRAVCGGVVASGARARDPFAGDFDGQWLGVARGRTRAAAKNGDQHRGATGRL